MNLCRERLRRSRTKREPQATHRASPVRRPKEQKREALTRPERKREQMQLGRHQEWNKAGRRLGRMQPGRHQEWNKAGRRLGRMQPGRHQKWNKAGHRLEQMQLEQKREALMRPERKPERNKVGCLERMQLERKRMRRRPQRGRTVPLLRQPVRRRRCSRRPMQPAVVRRAHRETVQKPTAQPSPQTKGARGAGKVRKHPLRSIWIKAIILSSLAISWS